MYEAAVFIAAEIIFGSHAVPIVVDVFIIAEVVVLDLRIKDEVLFAKGYVGPIMTALAACAQTHKSVDYFCAVAEPFQHYRERRCKALAGA